MNPSDLNEYEFVTQIRITDLDVWWQITRRLIEKFPEEEKKKAYSKMFAAVEEVLVACNPYGKEYFTTEKCQ